MKQGKNRLVTFTTDFGTADHYVAAMKGVVHGINHRVTCVDITHAVAPGDVRAAAFTLAAACRWFPEGTVHVAVVDPGVGTDRRVLAVKSKGHTFVGPDNGIFTYILDDDSEAVVHAVTNRRYRLQPVSATFHGRDVFAPAAAWLTRGVKLVRMGKAVHDAVRLDNAPPAVDGDRATVTVLHVDRFGNVVTNLRAGDLPAAWHDAGAVSLGGTTLVLAATYADVPAGAALALAGSSGYLEFSVNGGSAAAAFNVSGGDRLELTAGTAV